MQADSALCKATMRKTSGMGMRSHSMDDIAKFGQLLEVESTSQKAYNEFQTMARELADTFIGRAESPQAEAFIEQLCVENCLQNCVFVGHVKTDLDSVAGAIGAAHLWQGIATRAEREVNGEIIFMLQEAGLELPPYFDDVPGAASPDSEGKLLNVCLVDHSEEKQMVESLRKDPNRNQRICGVVDHHALSESFSSQKPLFMDLRPWGSMSSIIAHSFIRSNRSMPKSIARVLLGAILSDTLNLQSVTTTKADKMMVTFLAIMGEVEDHDELARRMFRAKTEWIVNLGAYEMARGDQKDFCCCGWKFGISVLEVTDPTPVLEVAQDLLFELRILKEEKGTDGEKHDRRKELDFAFLFVVDVTKQESVMLVAGGRELALAKAAFPDGQLCEAKNGITAPGDTIDAKETLMMVGGLVSRKAQFAPAVFNALSNGFTCHKKPMSLLTDSELVDEGAQAVTSAVAQMTEESYHDSVRTHRDYKGVEVAFKKRESLSNGTVHHFKPKSREVSSFDSQVAEISASPIAGA